MEKSYKERNYTRISWSDGCFIALRITKQQKSVSIKSITKTKNNRMSTLHFTVNFNTDKMKENRKKFSQ